MRIGSKPAQIPAVGMHQKTGCDGTVSTFILSEQSEFAAFLDLRLMPDPSGGQRISPPSELSNLLTQLK